MDSTVSSGFKFEEGKKETTRMHLWPSGISMGSRGYNESRHKTIPHNRFHKPLFRSWKWTVLLCTVSRRTSLKINNTLPKPSKKRGTIKYSPVSDAGTCSAEMPQRVGSKSWLGWRTQGWGTPQSCLSVLIHCLSVSVTCIRKLIKTYSVIFLNAWLVLGAGTFCHLE